jgi:transposase-like protein
MDELGPRGAERPSPRSPAEAEYTLVDFTRDYPDASACLDRLWRDRFAPDGRHAQCPRCARERKFHRTRTRLSYTCDACGLHVHPMKGTIFEKSTTSLELWFYAIYLLTSTRFGISAKQLERELGVGYKTAHRMIRQLRPKLVGDRYERRLPAGLEMVKSLGSAGETHQP